MTISKYKLWIAAVALLCCFLLTSLLSYWAADELFLSSAKNETLPLASHSIYSDVQRDLLPNITIASFMANDIFVKQWLQNGEKDVDTIRQYLSYTQDFFKTDTAFLVSNKTYNYYHSSKATYKLSRSNSEHQWFFSAIDDPSDYIINVDENTQVAKGQINLFIDYKLKHQDKVLAILGVGISFDRIESLLTQYEKKYNRQVYFVNKRGKIVATGDGKEEKSNHQNSKDFSAILSKHLSEKLGSSAPFELHDEGKTSYAIAHFLPELQSYLIVEQPQASSSRLLNTLGINIMLSLLFTGLAFMFMRLTLGKHHDKIAKMAIYDGLTGLLKRQSFENILEESIKQMDGTTADTVLLVMDIDNFKKINDTYGHLKGDEILVAVANTLKKNLRSNDPICRWGGEEFLVLLQHTDLEKSTVVANELRQEVNKLSFSHLNNTFVITISGGLSPLMGSGDQRACFERADRALLEAKATGKNRVVAMDYRGS